MKSGRFPLHARRYSDAIGAAFGDTFRYQYVVSEKALDIPEFEEKPFDGLHIYHCPELPAARIVTRAGQTLGWLLGRAFGLAGVPINHQHVVDLGSEPRSIESGLNEWLTSLSGRFVVLLNFTECGVSVSRAYMDAFASLGLVYEPTDRIFASSLLLALQRDIDPHPLFQLPDYAREFEELAGLIPETDPDTVAFPCCFGETFDANAKRLLSNHFLNLDTFEMKRWYPGGNAELNVSDAADIIVHRLSQTLLGLLSQPESGYLAISGGLDSRMVAAAAPDGFGKKFCYYSYADNWMSGIDVQLANMLAETVNSPFFGQASPENRRQSFFRRKRAEHRVRKRAAISSGFHTVGDRWWTKGYFRGLDKGALWLRGNGLEIVSARLWTPTLNAPLRKGTRHALRRLGYPSEDTRQFALVFDKFIDWYRTLPEHCTQVYHDMWYQELFLSYGQASFHAMNEQFYLAPASDQIVMAAARSVRPEERRNLDLFKRILAKARPALLEIPTTREVRGARKAAKMSLDETAV